MTRRSVRKNPPDPVIFERRCDWGGRLLAELGKMRKTPQWLGRRVGYRTPSSMRQVINGHQGISRAVYERVLDVVPAMRSVPAPPMFRESQGTGAPGPHKPHDYPKLGPRA